VLSFAAGLASSTATGCRIPEFQQTTSISINHDGRMRVQSLSTGDLLHAAGSPTCSPDAGQPFSRSGRQQLLDKQNKLTCIDCEDEITFSRKSDSDRHRRLKHAHGDRLRFVCSAQGCFRGQAPWSFARSDKLTSHIKNTHNLDTIFSHCPVKHCSYGPCTLEVLGVHIQHMHRTHKESRGVLNATSCKALRCPLWRCRKHVSAKKLLNHVASHAKEDIEAAKPNLELSGLLVHLTRGYNVTIQVVCPVCHTVCADIENFTRHLATSHLYTPQSGSQEHFEKWQAYLGQDRPQYAFQPIDIRVPWSSLRGVYVHSEDHAFACPSCPFSVAGVGGYGPDQEDKKRAINEHHLSLLRPEAEVVKELYPYRMQILRLWPEFVTHPVFANFD
jgi:hypothetical protein